MTTVNATRALITRTVRRLRALILPWPSRAERDAGLKAARQARLDAERGHAAARQVATELRTPRHTRYTPWAQLPTLGRRQIQDDRHDRSTCSPHISQRT